MHAEEGKKPLGNGYEELKMKTGGKKDETHARSGLKANVAIAMDCIFIIYSIIILMIHLSKACYLLAATFFFAIHTNYVK